MKIKSSHLILAIIFLIGFSDIFSQNISNPDSNSTILYFYRKRRSPTPIGLKINSTEIQKIKNGRRLIVILKDPGSVLEISSSNKLDSPSPYSFLRLPPQESNVYYIETSWGDIYDSSYKYTDSLGLGIVFILKNPQIGKMEFLNDKFFNDNSDQIQIIEDPTIDYQYLSHKIFPDDTLIYRSKKIIEWNDFRKQPTDPKSNDDHFLYLTFVTIAKKVNVLSGVIKVESFGTIRKDLSWAKPEIQSPTLLSYFQMKYEIAELYAKKVENEINSKYINAGNRSKLSGIIDIYLEKMKMTFQKMDNESNFGQNSERIEQWKINLNELIIK